MCKDDQHIREASIGANCVTFTRNYRLPNNTDGATRALSPRRQLSPATVQQRSTIAVRCQQGPADVTASSSSSSSLSSSSSARCYLWRTDQQRPAAEADCVDPVQPTLAPCDTAGVAWTRSYCDVKGRLLLDDQCILALKITSVILVF